MAELDKAGKVVPLGPRLDDLAFLPRASAFAMRFRANRLG
jgi:hypothetical protein